MGDEHSDLELAGLRFQISIYEQALRNDPEDTDALRFLAHAYTAVGRIEDGLVIDRKLVEILPQDARVRYNLACSCALCGHTDEALDTLEAACELGFTDLKLLARDKDLASIRNEPRFVALLARLEDK